MKIKTVIELVDGLRYRLRMMGVMLKGPTSVFCDNSAVVINTYAPEPTLNKKHNDIAYHRTREVSAAGTIHIAQEDGEPNLTDVLTKLMMGPWLKLLLSHILW
jgi:hypothetical protein